MPHITINGQHIPYDIRRSARARRISLRISASAGLQVVLPLSANAHTLDIASLLYSRADWILKHQTRLERAQQLIPKRLYTDGEHISYLGEDKTLRIVPSANRLRTTVLLEGDQLIIRLREGLAQDEHPATIKAALERWYHKQALAYIPPRVAQLARQHGFRYARVNIKNQKTRWGSCSNQRNLNFNLRLMMAPPAAIDYLIIHELCHLKEMNHSKRFWALVERYCPNYRHWVRWFKDNSPHLRL